MSGIKQCFAVVHWQHLNVVCTHPTHELGLHDALPAFAAWYAGIWRHDNCLCCLQHQQIATLGHVVGFMAQMSCNLQSLQIVRTVYS